MACHSSVRLSFGWALLSASLVMLSLYPRVASVTVDGLCGKIPASHVWDVQCGISPSAAEEYTSQFNTVRDPSTGERLPENADDYFTLSRKNGTSRMYYQLKQYGSNGTLKKTFPDGRLKANSDAVLYFVDEADVWYVTVISKKEHHTGDSANFSNLQINPGQQLMQGACAVSAQVYGMCGKIPVSHVWDVQWSGNPAATVEHMSSFNTPYDPHKRQRLSENPRDYFTLSKTTGGYYQLRQYASDGHLKATLPDGKIKANGYDVFYMIDGWYGTVITQNEQRMRDSVTLSNLQINPSSSIVEGACMVSAQLDEMCGKIPVSHVWDVQWSGSPDSTVEHMSSFDTPYDPHKGRRLSENPDDYFTLSKTTGDFYQLRQYASDGHLKATLPDGKIKADGHDVFYMIDDWYGTVITQKEHHRWDSATFTNLQINASSSVVEGACQVLAQLAEMCGKIPVSHVWDVQWSGSPASKVEHMSSFNTPYDPHRRQRLSEKPDDYFTLSKTTGDYYQLKQYASDGSLKATLPDGKIKADRHDVFYMIDDWYGTVITQKEHRMGDSATFSNLQINPASSVVEGACRVSAQLDDMCGKIPVSHVWDVQWSGRPESTVEQMSLFDTPYDPHKGRRLSEKPDDYFTLSKTIGDFYQLRQYASDGSLKATLPDGKIKADGHDVFYMIDGWYGTVVTQKEHHRWDSATFSNLQANPSSSVVEGACMVSAQVDGMCGKIPVSHVWDVQWSGNPSAILEYMSFFDTPYDPHNGQRLSEKPDDYFTLSKTTGGYYQLRQYASDGSLKATLPDGKIKAGGHDVFYMIDDWYGTVITQKEHHRFDSATLSNLQINPSSSAVEGACMVSLEVDGMCGKIPVSHVWDVQWSGDPSASLERMSGFATPYNPRTFQRLSEKPDDYFTLSKTIGENYQLKQYSSEGSLKATLPEGKVKANAYGVFYMIDGWYGTVITRWAHRRGDSSTFIGLQTNPPSSLVEGVCTSSAGTELGSNDSTGGRLSTLVSASVAILGIAAAALAVFSRRRLRRSPLATPMMSA